MDLRVLGPLQVWSDGSPVNLGGRQRRLVLAILLANADRTVSTERVIDEVWGGSPPDSARKTVQAHVAHLRKALNGDSELLFSSGDGYRVSPDPESLDAGRFEAAVAAARESADPAGTVRLLDEALGLFRGEPYAGLADDALTVKVEASRLDELRMNAREERLEALLATGDAPGVAVEADSLLAEHPLRERLWAIQMLALYRSGRQSEALRSYSRARQFLAEELGIEPSSELQALEEQILQQDTSLSESGLATATVSRSVEVRRNPYKGLRAFDEADAGDFFGRSELVRQLVDRLTMRPPPPLTVIAGPSGAGKSSLLWAGVLPLLRDRGLIVADMFPGEDPDSKLEGARREALLEVGEDAGGTVDVVAVDQFEELFTQAPAHKTDRFIARITDDSDPTLWIVTVRADFLDDLLAHPELGRRLQEALVLVPPLEDHEVEAAIVEPAHRVGVDLEPSLVATIVQEVQSRASALPLMQYALTDLFERRRGDVLTLDAYQREDGLSGALVRRADQVFERLSPDARNVARQTFLQLVTIADNGEFARRRVHRESLHADEPGLTDQILEQFGSQRLLTFDQDPTSGKATVELAHESLLVVWPRLSRWVDEAREDLLMRSALNNALAEWEASGRDEGFLLAGGRLAQHESWTADTDLPLSENEIEFLAESRRSEEFAHARRRGRRSLIMAGFGVAAAVATVFGVVAVQQAAEADAAAEAALANEHLALNNEAEAREAAAQASAAEMRATESAKIARGNALLASATAVMEEDLDLALLLTVEADQLLDGDVPAVEEALHNLLLRGTPSQALAVPEDSLTSSHAVAVSPDGEQVAVSSGNVITIFDRRSGAVLGSLGEASSENSSAIPGISYNSSGELLAAVGTDGIARIWDVASRALITSIPTGEDDTGFVLFADDDSVIITSIHTRTAWDIDTGDVLWRNHERVQTFGGAPIALDRTGGALAWVNKATGEVTAVDATSGDPLWSISVPVATFLDFHPTDDVIVVKSQSIGAELYDYSSGEPRLLHHFEQPAPTAVAFDQDGDRFAAGGDRETVVYEADPMQGWVLVAKVPTGTALPLSLEFLLDGRLVVGQPGSAAIWSLESAGEVARESTGIFAWTVDAVPGTSLVLASRPGFLGGNDVWIRNLDTGTIEHVFSADAVDHPLHAGAVRAVRADLAIAYLPNLGSIATLDPQTGEVLTVLEPFHNDGIAPFTVDLTVDGSLAGAIFLDGTAAMWDGTSGRLLQGLDVSSLGGTQAMRLSPTGRFFAAGGDNGLLLIDVATGESTDLPAEGAIVNVAFSPDERTLVASDDTLGLLNLYDVENQTRIASLRIPGSFDPEFTDDGELLVLAAAQSGVVTLDTNTWTRRWTVPLESLPGVVLTLDVAGDRLVFADTTGVIQELTLDRAELLRITMNRLRRGFTDQECEDFRIDPCPTLEEIRDR